MATEQEYRTKIRTERSWNSSRVRTLCIKHDYYDDGDTEEYCAMLEMVGKLEPTYENMYRIAKDIHDHTTGSVLSVIMFYLEREAVITSFEIEYHFPSGLVLKSLDSKCGWDVKYESDITLVLLTYPAFQTVMTEILDDAVQQAAKDRKAYEDIDELAEYIAKNYV